MRILGFIFLALLISTGIVSGDYYLPGSYLDQFLNEHFIETFGALVGFNIAAVIFLIGQLMALEEKYGKVLENTRREIKHNAYFLLSAFIISLAILFFRPDFLQNVPATANYIFYGINILVLAIFELAIFSIYEILTAVFRLSKN